MTPLRFILVGLGARSRIWRRILVEHPDCTLVGVVENNPERLETCDAPVAGGTTLAEVTGGHFADATRGSD